jgi:hypothetical protein
MPITLEPKPAFSIPSVVAIGCAVGSFYAGSFIGILLSIAAIALGALGVLLALSPSIRGGVISIISIVLGVIGIIAAVLRFIF